MRRLAASKIRVQRCQIGSSSSSDAVVVEEEEEVFEAIMGWVSEARDSRSEFEGLQ